MLHQFTITMPERAPVLASRRVFSRVCINAYVLVHVLASVRIFTSVRGEHMKEAD